MQLPHVFQPCDLVKAFEGHQRAAFLDPVVQDGHSGFESGERSRIGCIGTAVMSDQIGIDRADEILWTD